MKKVLIIELITALLILLFIYSGASKLVNMAAFKSAMHNQPVPAWLADLLIIILPPAELMIAASLVFDKTRFAGLLCFIALMGVFTIYVTAILAHFFQNVPCSCGELIQSLSWAQHLAFNLFFIALAVVAIKLKKQKRDVISGKE